MRKEQYLELLTSVDVLNTFNGGRSEPVLKFPVLVIESDDWGPGPVHHAQRLERLRQILLRHRDSRGRPAVMTLGVILALPDTAAIRAAGFDIGLAGFSITAVSVTGTALRAVPANSTA